MPKRLPKWAQLAVEERREIYLGDVDVVIEELRELPSDAHLEIEYDLGECYGHDTVVASWWRDMNETEYERERKRRSKARMERAAAAERAEAKRRAFYEKLRLEFEDAE